MAALFDSASSQRLTATGKVNSVPLSVGFWFKPQTTNTEALFGDYNSATTASKMWVGKGNGNVTINSTTTGGVTNTATATIATTAGVWLYVVGRFIASTNRKVSVLAGGQIVHATNGSAAAVSGLGTWALGGREMSTPDQFFTGSIAEFWIANVDIQADNGQLQNSLLWQLAYGGPFSVPSVAKELLDYRSLRVYPETRGEQGADIYSGKQGRVIWTQVNGVKTGDHPPLPYSYQRSGQTERPVVI